MFECNQCGLCCRNIDKIPQLKDFHNGNGICKYLHDNKCSIYDNSVNVNIRMYNFDDVQCTVIPSVAYGFVTGMNLQLC